MIITKAMNAGNNFSTVRSNYSDKKVSIVNFVKSVRSVA